MLGLFGWRVLTGCDVESGRAVLEAESPRIAVVFCDMLMGRGLRNECAEDLFRMCGKVLREQAIPFVVMSGSFEKSVLMGTGDFGMHELAKPFSVGEIEALLKRLVPADKWPVPEGAPV